MYERIGVWRAEQRRDSLPPETLDNNLNILLPIYLHAAPFQIKYIIQKKIYQPLGPQNTPSGETINLLDVHLCPKNTI
jgi:hypothetical protein